MSYQVELSPDHLDLSPYTRWKEKLTQYSLKEDKIPCFVCAISGKSLTAYHFKNRKKKNPPTR